MNALVKLTQYSEDDAGGSVYVVPAEAAAWYAWRPSPVRADEVTRITLRCGADLYVTETPEQVTRLFTESADAPSACELMDRARRPAYAAPAMPEGLAKFAAPPGAEDFGTSRKALCPWCGDLGCTACEEERKRREAALAQQRASEALKNYGEVMRSQGQELQAIIRRRKDWVPDSGGTP